MSRFHKAVKKTLNISGAALLTVSVLLLVYAVSARISGNEMPQVFGWGYTIVISDSMGQAMPKNAVIFVKEQDSYQSGDIVTYEDENGSLVSHRLVSLENGTAVTRGDRNNTADAPFASSQIRGKVRGIIPGLGAWLLRLQTPVGVIAVVGIALLLWFQPWRYFGRKAEDKNEDRI